MDRLTELEKLFNNFNIATQDGITVHGDLHRGYAIHAVTASSTSVGFPPSPPPPPPVDCCNREITEISTMTLSGTATVSCGGSCEGGCSFSRTWTRIPSTEPFNDIDDQFWLYTQNPSGSCNSMIVFFNQPDFLHPTATCQDESIGLNGSVDLNEFTIFPAAGDEFDIVMQFFAAIARLSGTCFDASCNGYSVEETIHVTACDVSPLLGDHVFTKHCDTAGGCSLDIEGHVIFA